MIHLIFMYFLWVTGWVCMCVCGTRSMASICIYLGMSRCKSSGLRALRLECEMWLIQMKEIRSQTILLIKVCSFVVIVLILELFIYFRFSVINKWSIVLKINTFYQYLSNFKFFRQKSYLSSFFCNKTLSFDNFIKMFENIGQIYKYNQFIVDSLDNL